MPAGLRSHQRAVSDVRDRLDRATAALDPPFAVVDLTAFDANAAALVGLAAGKPVRVASKSVRSRPLLRRVLGADGWRGVLAYTVAEATWLVDAGVADDVLVAYPSADRSALSALATDPRRAAATTVMVDALDHLDLIDSVVPPARREQVRVCLDLDASWRVGPLHFGVRRSPVRTPAAAAALAREVVGRRGFRLVGVMSYEAQIAGLGDAPPGQALRGLAIRGLQRASYAELLRRRASAVAAVRAVADLELVNGGGTGSVAATAADPSVTEVTSGSGLFGPTLFDAYRAWRPAPAAHFALPVVRRPGPGVATVLGGGWVASGPAERSRLPRPVLPPGLRLLGTEGAGEVQTPVRGAAADALRVGDRVWFRHAKAGELCEHVDELHLLVGDELVDTVPTYRGEGRAFL